MILVDTSIWIDHLRDRDLTLSAFSRRGRSFATRSSLPETAMLAFIEANALVGTGIGYVDAHLLISARLTPGASPWTRDRRLKQAAARLDLLYAG